MPNWRRRIVGFEEVDPKSITPHPDNPRTHSERQANVLKGLLGEVGWVDAAILNQRTGRLVDGHLRLKQCLETGEPLPCLLVDLSEAEEALVLVTLDETAKLAGTDPIKLEGLLANVNCEDPSVEGLLEDMAKVSGLHVAARGDDSTHSPKTETFQYTLSFDTEEQREAWYAWLEWLRDAYPVEPGVAARIEAFVRDGDFKG